VKRWVDHCIAPKVEDAPSDSSWWIEPEMADRRVFRTRALIEEPRMSRTRFGRMEKPSFGPEGDRLTPKSPGARSEMR